MARPKNNAPMTATASNCGHTTSSLAPRYRIDCAKATKCVYGEICIKRASQGGMLSSCYYSHNIKLRTSMATFRGRRNRRTHVREVAQVPNDGRIRQQFEEQRVLDTSFMRSDRRHHLDGQT